MLRSPIKFGTSPILCGRKAETHPSGMYVCLFFLDHVRRLESISYFNTNALFLILIWIHSESLDSMTKKMIGLEHICLKMVFDSYGLKKYHESLEEKDNTINVVHLIKYDSLATDEPAIGATAHTDKGIITVLNSNIQGLEILSKENKWILVEPRKDTFTIFIGDSLKVNVLDSYSHFFFLVKATASFV